MKSSVIRTISLPWYQKPMRIGALQCNFEGGERQTLGVIDKWIAMGMNVEQLFHPCADSYSSLFDEHRHGRILRRYLEKARHKGLRIILYLNVHIIGPADAHRYREWAQQSSDGSFPKLYGTYYATCYNGPWRGRFFKSLESLARYDIDGIFLDGPMMIEGGCHCRHCRAKFKEWFWRPMGKEPAGFEFAERTLREFVAETYRRFKAIKPRGVMYQNLPLEYARASSVNLRKILSYNDIVGTEGGFMFYGPPKNAWLWKPGFAARLLEAVAPEKPRVIFMAGDQKCWSWYMHQPAETALCIASSLRQRCRCNTRYT